MSAVVGGGGPAVPADPRATWPHLRRMDARRSLREYLAAIWDRREFVLTVPLGELRAQNQNNVVGQAWHLLNPLLLVLVYWLVFDIFLGVGSGDGGARASLFTGTNYLGFLVAGIIPYTYSAKVMQSGARTVVSNRRLVRSISFPRAVLPLSATLTEFLAQLPAIGVMIILLVVTGEPVGWSWLLIVPGFLLQTLFSFGLACVTARLTFHFNDVQQLLPYLIRLLFYVSGIIFSLDRTSGALRLLLSLNPFNAFVRIFRESTLQAPVAAGVDPWLVAGVWSLGLLVAGFVFFRAAESEYGNV